MEQMLYGSVSIIKMYVHGQICLSSAPNWVNLFCAILGHDVTVLGTNLQQWHMACQNSGKSVHKHRSYDLKKMWWTDRQLTEAY